MGELNMSEHLTVIEQTSGIVRRNGSLFVIATGCALPSRGDRVAWIIDNLTPESPTPDQISVLTSVLKPALEAYGTE